VHLLCLSCDGRYWLCCDRNRPSHPPFFSNDRAHPGIYTLSLHDALPISTANSSIGMGGPAMIEGGGLGVFHPDQVGPMHVQVPGGVVDVPVADEAEAVRAAKQYLGYFQGPVGAWECADQRLLRGIVPENRLRVYDVRAVIRTLADTGSVLELRRHFGL